MSFQIAAFYIRFAIFSKFSSSCRSSSDFHSQDWRRVELYHTWTSIKNRRHDYSKLKRRRWKKLKKASTIFLSKVALNFVTWATEPENFHRIHSPHFALLYVISMQSEAKFKPKKCWEWNKKKLLNIHFPFSNFRAESEDNWTKRSFR